MLHMLHKSRLARALWIEIGFPLQWIESVSVEARESLVDWNMILSKALLVKYVEARESLVDWNSLQWSFINFVTSRGSREPCGLKSAYKSAAWSGQSVEARESLVDWNITCGPFSSHDSLSRLARALWIEIMKWCRLYQHHIVQARESLADQKIPVSP